MPMKGKLTLGIYDITLYMSSFKGLVVPKDYVISFNYFILD